MAPKELNFITGNTNKLNEVREILSSVPSLTLQSQNVDLPEIQGTIEDISRHKCSTAADIVCRMYTSLSKRSKLRGEMADGMFS